MSEPSQHRAPHAQRVGVWDEASAAHPNAPAGARKTDTLLADIIDKMGRPIAVFDSSDRLLLCNESFRWFVGTSTSNVEGETYEALLDAHLEGERYQGTPRSVAEIRKRVLAYHRSPIGFLQVSMGGHLWKIVERRLDRGGTVCSASDITESVAHEAMLEAARKAADRANATKSELLTSMTHELRTPLNSIVGFTQLLKRDKKDPISKRHREWIEHVLHGCEHLMQLIDEVLDISCIESGKLSLCLEPVDITELFEQVVSTLSPLAREANIALVDGAHPSRPVGVLADRTRLSQILLNFGSNAIKYGRAGGRVTLGAEVFEGKIRLGVEDDGVGIAEQHHAKLFSPFFRAGQESGQAPGSGMGLSISKRLAECMNGRVGFRSKPFEGSVFWVELPPCAAPPEGNR